MGFSRTSHETEKELWQQGLDDGCELIVFQKEAVVAELGSDFVVSCSRNARSDMLLLADREELVAVDAYHHAVGLDGPQSRLDTATATADIVAVSRRAEVLPLE